ncbi:MAG: type II toxin-antitoxin system RelE/ParE family toxin [Candidatus Sericytochromatia bacterium]|nr:type II toxin-antitoxin system RelE/ParE family toxin [Candidatus Tanganyikabacteria bacterium]
MLLEWSPAAIKDAAALQEQDRERVARAIERFAVTGHGDVTRLTGKDREMRLKVGPWRVRFKVEGDTMKIQRVLRRREDTYKV